MKIRPIIAMKKLLNIRCGEIQASFACVQVSIAKVALRPLVRKAYPIPPELELCETDE
jgi:hypothetical protein